MAGFATSILSIGSLVHSIFLTWTHQAKGQSDIDVGVSLTISFSTESRPSDRPSSCYDRFSTLTWIGSSHSRRVRPSSSPDLLFISQTRSFFYSPGRHALSSRFVVASDLVLFSFLSIAKFIPFPSFSCTAVMLLWALIFFAVAICAWAWEERLKGADPRGWLVSSSTTTIMAITLVTVFSSIGSVSVYITLDLSSSSHADFSSSPFPPHVPDSSDPSSKPRL